MKKILFATFFIGILFITSSLWAQNRDNETIILDDKNHENETVIELKNGNLYIDGKKISSADVKKEIKIIKKNGGRNIFSDNDDIEIILDQPSQISEKRASLGIRIQDAEKGVEIVEIMPNSAAEKAGLKVGDIITKINGKNIKNAQELSETIAKMKPNDEVDIAINDHGKELTAKAKLGEGNAIVQNDKETFSFPDIMKEFEKIFPRDINFPMSKPRLGLDVEEIDNGLKVLDIEKESLAEKGGVQVGDIITKMGNKEVKNISDFKDALRENEGENFNINVLRNGSTKSLTLEAPKARRRAQF